MTLPTTPPTDGAVLKLEALRKDPGRSAILSSWALPTVVRAHSVMEECALAQSDRSPLNP